MSYVHYELCYAKILVHAMIFAISGKFQHYFMLIGTILFPDIAIFGNFGHKSFLNSLYGNDCHNWQLLVQ